MEQMPTAYSANMARYLQLLPLWRERVEQRMSAEDKVQRAEVMFSCHSCAIEGNSYSVDDTRALKELGLGFTPKGKTLVETMEMLDHFHAYEYMVEHVTDPLTEDFVKHLHYLLTEHTIAYLHEGARPGEYTDTDMCAGSTIFGDHNELIAQVPALLSATEGALQKGLPPMEVAARFHGFFEHLHPFRDGNGRLGRLLVNLLLLRSGLPVLIIPLERRDEYLSALRLFRNESQEHLIDFFYKTAADQFARDLDEKQRSSRPMMFLF